MKLILKPCWLSHNQTEAEGRQQPSAGQRQPTMLTIRRPCDSRDPACESKSMLFWISVEMTSLILSAGGVWGELGPSDSRRTPPSTRLGPSPSSPPLGSAVHPTGSLLERSGSLRHDIQTENLKNAHFWSLQLGFGRALAAARARGCPFCVNLGSQNGSQRCMMATLRGPFAQFGALLGKTERQIQRVLRQI